MILRNFYKVKKAIFLDRDGVINIDYGYVHKIENFIFIKGVFKALRILQELDYLLIIVTNQAGIAKSIFCESDLNLLHEHMNNELKKEKIYLDGIYYCPHHIEGNNPFYSIKCNCRKPQPGMILNAINDFNIDLGNSILIGDKFSDILAGKNAKIPFTILLNSKYLNDSFHKTKPTFHCKNLLDAANLINSLKK